MRIAIAAVTGTRGGPRTYALRLLEALVALDAADSYTLFSDERDAAQNLHGIDRIRVGVPFKAARPAVEALLLPLKVRGARCDVFHGTKQSLPAGNPGARVVTVHDLAPMLQPETFQRGAGAWLRRSTAAAARRADRIVAVSQTTARDLREVLGVPPEKIRVVGHGVDERFRGPHDPERIADVRTRHRLPSDYVACIGTIQPRKNVDVVLDAFERLEKKGRVPPTLVVAGRAGWMSDEVVRRARSMPRVRWLGEVPDEDVPPLCAGSSLFVSPSSYEGFGLAVAEAMAAGVATIAGSGSACDEVVGEAGVLVPPRDVGALADAVDALLSDDARRKSLADAGSRRARSFTWEASARATREVYREAVIARGGRA